MYYKPDGSLDTKWVDSEALAVARKLALKDPDDKPDLTGSQLRKFYADIKNLERIWKNQQCDETVFRSLLPQVKILKAKTIYAQKRKAVPHRFTVWLNKHVDAVSTPKDFEAFLLHFEAVVGFCYGEGLKD